MPAPLRPHGSSALLSNGKCNAFASHILEAKHGLNRPGRLHTTIVTAVAGSAKRGPAPTPASAAVAGQSTATPQSFNGRCGLRLTSSSISATGPAPTLPVASSRQLKRTDTVKLGPITVDDISEKVHAVILAGGPSDNPLARYRAMPAVELGSNTQLIDVPISNAIRSGVNKMYVLTQFNSHTLNTHVTNNYPPDVFGATKRQGYVDVLACQQTPGYSTWYRGSADAVRRNLPSILEPHRGNVLPEDLLILSGHAIYQMDYKELLRTHWEANADLTIATASVGWQQAPHRGLTRVDPDTGLVTSFVEKPTGHRLEALAHASKHSTPAQPFEASMGLYVFKRVVLERLLAENEDHFGSDAGPDTHFGHDVIPHALRDGCTIAAHHFDGYWRDVASLRDFYEVNLELARPSAPLSFYEVDQAIVSKGEVLPPSIIHACQLRDTLVGEGSVLRGSKITGCVIGCNSFIGEGCELIDSLVLGNDTYTNEASRAASRAKGEAVLGIGNGSYINGAVIDDNAAIGFNVRINNDAGIQEADRTEDGYVIQDGIIAILKSAVIPNDTIIGRG